MNNPKQLYARNNGLPITTKHSSSMKVLPKIENITKAKNINDLLILRQNHTPIQFNHKKPSIAGVEQQNHQAQYEDIQSNNKNLGKRSSQLRIDTYEQPKATPQYKSLAKSQIGFNTSSASKQMARNASGIYDNTNQGSLILNNQSPSVKQSLTKIPLQVSTPQERGKTPKFSSPITQLQMDADQNRLDFMLEKGINFEKNSQLVKLKQDNFDLRQEVRRLEAELRRLRQDCELLQQQNLKLSMSQQNMERNGSFFTQDESYLQLEKKIQQNEFHKQQMQGMKSQYESDIQQLKEQIGSLTQNLQESQEQILNYQSHKCEAKVEYKEVIVNSSNVQECASCQQKFKQIQEQEVHIAALESNMVTFKAQNENIVSESQSLREWQAKTKETHQREKEYYEKHIQEQEDEILKLDKQLRDYKKLYDDLNEKIKQVKNGSDFSKVLLRNEYSLLRSEIVDSLERLCKERLDRINDNSTQIQSLQQKYEEEKSKSSKLRDEVNQLNQHLDWLKKRGIQQQKQNGTFNYLGLSEEILSLKKVIDQHIQEIPNKDSLTNFQSKVEEMNMLNKQMVDKINKISQEEEKSKKIVDQNPILKQFEIAQTKVEYHIACAKCEDILDEAITCVPCGHNYCKKCHYKRDSSYIKPGEMDEEMPDAAISCMKCGPSTMIYRNESLDDMISMYKVMKSSKEVMKVYLSSQ